MLFRSDLATLKVTTLQDRNEDSDLNIQIDVEFHDGEARANFTPNQKEVYFYDLVAVEEYDVESNGDDKTFIDNMLIHYGSSEMLKNKLAFIPSYIETGALVKGIEYYAIAFGYDDGATTAVFKHRFTFTGEDSQGVPAQRFFAPEIKPIENSLYQLMVQK